MKKDFYKKKIEIKENNDLIAKFHQDINNLIIKSQIPSREQMKTEALYFFLLLAKFNFFKIKCRTAIEAFNFRKRSNYKLPSKIHK